MRRGQIGLAAVSALVIALLAGQPAAAEKRGGILKLASPASPASMSPMEATTIVAELPIMGVFNNLIVFEQHDRGGTRNDRHPSILSKDPSQGLYRCPQSADQRAGPRSGHPCVLWLRFEPKLNIFNSWRMEDVWLDK
jgi:hypothetical protein